MITSARCPDSKTLPSRSCTHLRGAVLNNSIVHRYRYHSRSLLHRRLSPCRIAPASTVTTIPEGQSRTPDSRRPTWSAEEYAGFWNSYQNEEAYQIDAASVEGTIPSDLKGTFFRNGPGVFEINGEPLHVFDGHGLVASIAIKGGEASFRSRYVRTPVYEEEMEQQKQVLYRGFGTQKPGGVLANMFDIRDKPVANTSLVEWAGELWALWEAHRPFVLNPDTLETIGEDDLGGVLKENQAFCAHPQIDPVSGRLVAFGLGLRHAEGKLHIYELEQDGRVAVHKILKISMQPPLYTHDFMVTPSWYVFFEPPLSVRWDKFGGYLLGQNEQTQMVKFDSSRVGKWMLIPRGREGEPLIIETPPQFIWHYASACEDPVTGILTVDACVFDEFSPGEFDLRDPSTIAKDTLRRSIINPSAGTAVTTETLTRSADFPQINPAFLGRADLKYCYLAASASEVTHFPFQSVLKVDLASGDYNEWRAPNGCFVGEAIFVARAHQAPHSSSATALPVDDALANSREESSNSPAENGGGSGSEEAQAEDDGYLVTLMFDGQKKRSSLVILDAQKLKEGPLALIHMQTPLPLAFHCMWSTTYYGMG